MSDKDDLHEGPIRNAFSMPATAISRGINKVGNQVASALGSNKADGRMARDAAVDELYKRWRQWLGAAGKRPTVGNLEIFLRQSFNNVLKPNEVRSAVFTHFGIPETPPTRTTPHIGGRGPSPSPSPTPSPWAPPPASGGPTPAPGPRPGPTGPRIPPTPAGGPAPAPGPTPTPTPPAGGNPPTPPTGSPPAPGGAPSGKPKRRRTTSSQSSFNAASPANLAKEEVIHKIVSPSATLADIKDAIKKAKAQYETDHGVDSKEWKKAVREIQAWHSNPAVKKKAIKNLLADIRTYETFEVQVRNAIRGYQDKTFSDIAHELMLVEKKQMDVNTVISSGQVHDAITKVLGRALSKNPTTGANNGAFSGAFGNSSAAGYPSGSSPRTLDVEEINSILRSQGVPNDVITKLKDQVYNAKSFAEALRAIDTPAERDAAMKAFAAVLVLLRKQ